MRKWFVAGMAALLMLALAGCWAGEVKSEITITSAEGAGTRTITVDVLKDHVAKPDGNGNVDDNSAYFPNGVAAVEQWLKATLPDGFQVELRDEADKHVFAVTYSFANLADYNAKTKLLIGEDRWNEEGLQDAVLQTKAVDGGHEVTLIEDRAVLKGILLSYLTPIYLDGELFDPTHGGHDVVKLDEVYTLNGLAIQIGEQRESFDLTGEGAAAGPASATGFLAVGAAGQEAGVGEEAQGSEESQAAQAANPKTADGGVGMFVMLAVLAAAAAVWAGTMKRGGERG